jgi:hypothetical protein
MADFKPLRNIVNINEEDDSGWTPLRSIAVGEAPKRNALTAGLSAGTDVLQGLGYSALGGAADLANQVGIPYAGDVRDWANEQARRNAIDASINGRPDLERIEDQTLGSAVPYLGYQVAKQVPIMAGITAAQFVPGLGQAASATGLTRLGAVVPRALGGGGLEAGASVAARRAALAQGEALATGTMVGSGLGFGSLYGESVEGGDPNALKALALSPIYGAAEAVLPAVLQGGLRVPTNFSGNRALRMAKAGGIAGAGESLTELGQNELEMGMRSDLTPEQKYSQRLNSAAAGFFVGGTLGSSGGFADRMAAGQEADLMPSTEKKPTQPVQYGLVTQPAPLQQRINEQLGIGLKPVAGKKYASQFEAAFNEPSGQYAQDPATGIERQLTMGELIQLGTTPLDLTVANPAGTAAVQAAASVVTPERAAQKVFRDTYGIPKTPANEQIIADIEADGYTWDSPEIVDLRNFVVQQNALSKRNLAKAQQMLDAITIEARKGPTNVSPAPAPIPTAPTGLAAGSPLVQGGMGATGPSNVGNVQPNTSPTITGTPAGQTAPAPAASGQPTTVVKTQRQLPTTRGAAGTTPLVDTSDDALEIARATGNAGEIEAMREDEAGLRADRTSLTDEDTTKIVATRFAKSKNAKRDGEILNAYLTALRTNAGTDKAAIQNAIGERYGITAVAVRKIGNPSKLVEAGTELGFSAEQVLDLFQVDDNTKAQYTEIGKLEAEIKDLRKAYDKATDANKRAEVADRMAALSERITKIKEKAADERATAFSAGLQEAGVSAAEGESAGFGFDTEREWSRVEGESKLASQVLELSNQIDSLRASAEQLAAQGQTEAAQAARDAIAARQAKIDAVLAEVQGETKPVSKAAPDVAEARKRWNDAGRDLTKLSVEDLQVLKGYTASIKNKALSDKIAAEISSRGATQEAPNAVQVQSPAGVSVQPKTEAGQGVGQEVRRAEKPASKGEVAILTPQEQYEKVTAGFPAPAWVDLTPAQQSSLTDLARRDQLNLAAVNRFVTAQPQQQTQAQLADESNIIDVEARVINETVKPQVAKLAAPQVDRLEKHYGVARDTAEFLAKVKEDIVLYVNKGASAVAGAIRDVIKAMAEGVLAVSLIFNPNANLDRFEFNVQQVIERTAEVRAEVPAEAAAKMSQLAKDVYSRVAPAAMESGKGFIVADKPNGMIHIFTSKGKVIVQDTALFGMDAGDVMTGQKITPAGKFTMKAQKWEDYAGGFTLDVWTSKGEFEGIAIHAAYLGVPSQNRLTRLATPTAADNKISGGCINTAHDTFIEKIIPNLDVLDGGMLFILPDAQETTASLFPAQTKTTKTPVQDTKAASADRAVTGKEEKFLFGKAPEVTKPYTAQQLLAEIKDFVRTDIPGRKLQVFDSIADMLQSPIEDLRVLAKVINDQNAYGVAVDGTAYLIANRIQQGRARSTFLHEVGAHLGLENLLPNKLYDTLVDQLVEWGQKNDGSLESDLAKRAAARVKAAKTPREDQAAELLAYFIEEAVDAGINPTAAEKLSGPLSQWFRTLWAAFKVAIRRLGFKPETLSASDVINLAYGAARLEIAGTWHGTAANFNKFSNKFMGAGEGNQAYGWGAYVAQLTGIAKGYWRDDVRRKTRDATSELAKYQGWSLSTDVIDPMTRDVLLRANTVVDKVFAFDVKEVVKDYGVDSIQLTDPKTGRTEDVFVGSIAPEGNLLRVDLAIGDDETLDWGLPMSQQSQLVRDAFEKFSVEVLKRPKPDWSKAGRFRGADYYIDMGIDLTGIDPTTKEQMAKVQKAASEWLDANGVKGIKYFDAMSRTDQMDANTARFTKDGKTVTGQDALRELYFTPGEIVQGYGGPDKVLAYNGGTDFLGGWSVDVIAVDKDGNPRRGETKRRHATEPDFTKLKAALEARGWKLSDDYRTRNVVVFNEKNMLRVSSARGADRQRMRFGKNAPDQGMIAKNVAKLPKAAQQPVRNMLGAIGDVSGKGLDYLVFTSDLVNRAVAAGIPSAKKFVDLIGKSKAEARENEIAVEKIADMYALVPEKDRGTGETSVNRFLFDSTREAKWGYGQFRDQAMGDRFDALSKESQDFVKAVFEHGSNVLAQKKKVVLDSTNSEYDAMIAMAQKAVAQATDPKKQKQLASDLASLKAEKVATIKRFQTLFKIRDGMPYAPIKRNGSHVVIAKSQEYLDAEAAEDAKKITELESNGDHYHVSFTDGKWEGRTLQQQLIDQGAFASVELAERDSMVDEMYSGHSALRELTAMRSRVDEQAKDDDRSASKMLNLISQMYLEALAEGSARKSEMRRRGVDGEVDMVRSFAQQGRADANFMASVKYNPQVQDALQEMRTQAKGGNRERKSELFNELAKRYMQSMEHNPRPWLNKLTRMSSIYYLATSPAYYLQNLTQPWMMSVPAMAGQHDYTAASSALFKAYTELGGVMNSAKLLKQQFDFDKVPADVRDAIKELVNRGKIDIGLDTEIGEFKVGGDSYVARKISNADKALRLAVQKVESINRLSTAMAAYRLELERAKKDSKIADPKAAAVDYADRILTETHGDYTSFNAPRVFNTGFGKVALQFRKFQLIQLAFYAKLIKESLTGADRKAALKTLGYSLGHTGLLAGLMGMPGYAAISWAIGALLGDDDEPYDVTAEIRKAIGDEAVANLVLKGAPTLAGVDISGKVGAGNMLSIMPFSQADLSTTAGRAEAFGTLIGGASLGMTSRMVDGLGLMLSGDWYRGLEQTLPKGVGDAIKAYRISQEGMTRRNGDVLLPASEISTIESILQGFGIASVQQNVVYERTNAVKALTTNFQERTTEIKNQYTKADRNGDDEAKAKARDAWKKLQDARARNGLERKPLSDLLKAPAEQRKREKETVGGVQYTKATKKLAQQYAEE